MRRKDDSNFQGNSEGQVTNKKECFVIMPISDRTPYEEGHFRIVYEHLIKPACLKAGFSPIRSDQIQETNLIVKDILKRLLNSEMAICDLSGQNPNVMFELGIRQSFNLPVTIIRDSKTPRIFDIDGLRCIEYDRELRIDKIMESVNIVAETLINTHVSKENSLIESLSIAPAKIPTERVLSDDTSIILESIKDIKDQLNSVKRRLNRDKYRSVVFIDPDESYNDTRWGKLSELGSCGESDQDASLPFELFGRLVGHSDNESTKSTNKNDLNDDGHNQPSV